MPPLLTICTTSYNQEKFIAQTLEGFVKQRTDFEFEAIVADDCSTDGTAKIVAGYAEKYPGIIKPVLRDKNIGMTANFSNVLSKATGKYVAICEGDDYWVDPLKLQKQVDFLEANPEYAICFHPVKVLMTDAKLVDDFITPGASETTDIYELAKGNYIHTPSVVFRNNPDVVRDFVSLKSPLGDYALHMLNAQHGKIKKLPDVMAVYRHGVGLWSAGSPAYTYPTYHTFLCLLCGYFKDKNEVLYRVLVKRRNGSASGYMDFLFQTGDSNGASDIFNVLDDDSKKNLLKYFVSSERSLAAIKSSRGWRFLQILYRFRDTLMPIGSMRWRYLEGSLKFVYGFYKRRLS